MASPKGTWCPVAEAGLKLVIRLAYHPSLPTALGCQALCQLLQGTEAEVLNGGWGWGFCFPGDTCPCLETPFIVTIWGREWPLAGRP